MKRIIFILTALLLINGVQAQKETNIWHFGRNAGLDFNVLTPSVLANNMAWNGSSWGSGNLWITNIPTFVKGSVNTHEGCFSISDAAGSLLMSSDGSFLYNKNGQPMNTVALGGNSSASQSGIVIPKPGDPDKYYVVSVGASGTTYIQYAEVDMTLNSGFGSIIKQNIPVSGLTDENIAVIPNSNGIDYWLVNRTKNDYHVWKVTSSGFTYYNATPTGSLNIYSGDCIGEIIVSPDGTKIVSLTFTRNEVLSANFDAATGLVSNTKVVSHAVQPAYGVYGGCFSPNGKFFYFTFIEQAGGSHEAYRIAWDKLNSTDFGSNYKSIYKISNIHRGPDGRLYGIGLNDPNLYIIQDPDNGDSDVIRVNNFFPVTNMPTAGLPSFLSSFLSSNLNIYPLACTQNARDISVEITSGGGSPATSIEWDFGDGTLSARLPITPNVTQIYTQKHIYATPGTKTIVIKPYDNNNVPKTPKSFQIKVIPCAIKTNRMIRTNLKDQGEP